uniref:ABC transporter domain-containing protein n=1 Tax=Globisporangium ultimum (strain ATCC 200006 / CBS 805.95 / DAOM BR144) TaxID=431595 RepID=K3X547_GLOUD
MGGVIESDEEVKKLQVLMAFNAQTLHENIAHAAERAIGRTLPQMQVRFKDVSVTADCVVIETGKRSHDWRDDLPTLTNTVLKKISGCSLKKHVVKKQILHPMSGAFKPGEITLVLGQPGSGKSSLMKILSGRFPKAKHVTLNGEISYNDKQNQELKNRVPQFISYVNQHDNHFPTLTVKETLRFAHAFCGNKLGKFEESLFKEGTTEEIETALSMLRTLIQYFPDVIIQQLGLQVCQDTIIGNAMIRGVSGGQRKRVTTGEMQFGHKHAMFMDEISTGLDSAATYDIVNTQRTIAKQLRKTIVISLLQPSPEVFALFDNVLILNEGYLMYHGPRDEIVGYFENLGFVCPPRRDVADFLLDLGTDQQTKYQVPIVGGTQQNPKHPRTALEFADLFKASTIYQQTLRSVNAPVDTVLVNDMKDYLSQRGEFFQSLMGNLMTLLRRESLILRRNTAFLKGRCTMVVVMGLLYGTTFYQFNPLNIQLVMGVIFAAVMFLSMGQASQIEPFMVGRSVFYKQRGANFYRSAAYVVASSLSQMPLAVAESLAFGSIVYWLCGFASDAGAFFMFELLLLLTNFAFTAWFFFLAAACPNLNVAKPLSMVSILVFVLFAGFVIVKDQLPDYVRWLYWLDPIAWTLRALAVNQYRTAELDVCDYGGVNYCKLFDKNAGEYYLGLFDVPSEKHWVPLTVLVLLLLYFFFMLLSCFVLEFKRYESPENLGGGTTDEDQNENEQQRQKVAAKILVKSAVGPVIDAPNDSKMEKSNVVAPILSKTNIKEHIHVTPVTLAFNDLWYSVPDPSNPKESIDLLQGVTGYAAPGTMTALMGSSGAGKTTLMDVIAGRKTGGKIRGDILLNGHRATKLAIRRCTGYCEQMDIHSEAATIREALTFSAFMRLPGKLPPRQKHASVTECLDLLDLNPIADKIIRGSSTEQMKRLTIGVELAAQPSVLFLDEPTSGLDARSAKTIMDGARKVASTGRTIICTIHQPSSEVFQLFDCLLLLKRGGETVFYGNLGCECVHLINYFESIPGVEKIAAGYNPATWMLECIGAGVGNAGSSSGIGATNFVEIFRKSELKTVLDEFMAKPGVSRPSPEFTELIFSNKFASDSNTQMKFLVRRFFDMYWRTPSYNLTRIGISIVLALIFGIIFAGANYTTYQGVNSGVGMIFMTTLFNAMVSFNSVLPITSEERASFYREQASQMYHPFWYFLGSTLVEIPHVLVSSAVFTAVFFPMVGFTGFANAILYWINVSLIVLLMTYIGQFLIYATPSIEVASIMGVLLNSIHMLFMGFSPPAAAIPKVYKWIHYATPQRYALANLAAIVFSNCPEETSDNLGCHSLDGAPISLGKITVKGYVESVFGMKHDEMAMNFGVLLAFIVFFRILALLSLCYLNHQKR